MEEVNNALIDILKCSISLVEATILNIVGTAETYNLTNEQFYIDFEDLLNKISNLDHNAGIGSIINKQ